jgi:hypothetical protein
MGVWGRMPVSSFLEGERWEMVVCRFIVQMDVSVCLMSLRIARNISTV